MFQVIIIIVVGLIFSIFLLTGHDFGKKREESKGNPSVRVTGTSGDVEKGSVTFNQTFLPVKFPEDLPIYPSARLLSSEVRSEDSGFIVLTVNSSPLQITKYYEENLSKFGWGIEAKSNDGKNASFSAVKNNKASTIGIRLTDNGGTLLTITFGPK